MEQAADGAEQEVPEPPRRDAMLMQFPRRCRTFNDRLANRCYFTRRSEPQAHDTRLRYGGRLGPQRKLRSNAGDIVDALQAAHVSSARSQRSCVKGMHCFAVRGTKADMHALEW
jgi:hypothetical protein